MYIYSEVNFRSLRTSKFLDKTSQIAEETLVIMIDSAQETKLQRDKS